MVTQELLTYISEQQKAGFTLEQLRPALQEAGWKEGLIKEAFDSILGKVTTASNTVLATKPEALTSPTMHTSQSHQPTVASPALSTMRVNKPHTDHVLASSNVHNEVGDTAGAIAQTASAIGAAATGLGATALAGTAATVHQTANTLQTGLDRAVADLGMNAHAVKKGPHIDVNTSVPTRTAHTPRTMSSMQQSTMSSPAMNSSSTMTMERPRVGSSYQQPVASVASPSYAKPSSMSGVQSATPVRSGVMNRREVKKKIKNERSVDSAGSGVRAFWFVLETLILLAILAGLIFGIYQVYSSGTTYETLEETL